MSPLIHTSAPGKVIILGEHSVVYGRQALCGVVDSCRIHTWVDKHEKEEISITMESSFKSYTVSKTIHFNKIDEIKREFELEIQNLEGVYNVDVAYQKYFLDNEDDHLSKSIVIIVLYFSLLLSSQFDQKIGFSIKVHNQGLLEEKGLGGSAALCTSIAAALLLLYQGECSCPNEMKDAIQKLAFKGEKLFHGKPSGVDNAVSCFGGLIQFRRDLQTGAVHMNHLQSPRIPLLLIDSMLPKNTAAMIQRVVQKRETHPERVDAQFDEINALVQSVISKDGTILLDTVTQAIEKNQEILRSLGVSCEAIEKIVTIANQHGYVAKLTGGGGGGCVIAMSRYPTDKDEENIINDLEQNGFIVHKISVGGEGVIMEYTHSIV